MAFEDWIVPFSGFLGGVILGLAARLGRFCTLTAFEDAIFGGGTRRLRMWALAIGVSILGVLALQAGGWFSPADSFYLTAPVPVISTIGGGFVFGLGMALVGTCGYGSLARFGGGDLSGLVTILVIAITGYFASTGALGMLRNAYLPPESASAAEAGVSHMAANALGLAPWAVSLMISGVLIAFALGRRNVEWPSMIWAAIVGMVIAAGWAVTAWHFQVSFGEAAMRSFSYVRPMGDAVIYTMTSSGTKFGFGAASVFGVIIGAFIGALIRREFRWEACDDARTLKRQILGAVCMGAGGIFALGCTVGQGLSAASVLALSAPIAIAAMFCGAWCGLQWLVRGSVIGPLLEVLRLR